MKVAITGATGFIGQYTVNHLLDAGYKVIALGRNKSKLDAVFNNTIEKRETDFSIENLKEVLSEVDIIVHLAAMRLNKDLDPLILTPYIASNIIVTQNLLKSAQLLNIKRFCFASTIGVYSMSNTPPFVETEPSAPISIYGLSKITCENLGNLYSSKSNLQVTNLRFSSIFGYGEKPGVVFTDYINLARSGKTLEIWGEGKTTIDFLYVKDAVSAIERAISENAPQGTYNIGSNRGYSVKDIAETINDVFENKNNLSYISNKKEGGYTVFMNSKKAEKYLGWNANWNLYSAIADIKKYYDK